MKPKPQPASSIKRVPTEQQLQAMCRNVELAMLRRGVTSAEVALLRAAPTDPLGAAMAISAFRTRKVEGG